MTITDANRSREVQLAFNIRGFEPEEVKIQTQHGRLTISAIRKN